MVTAFKFKKAELGKFQSEFSDSAIVNFAPDCRIFGVTMGRFSLIDLIHSILKKTGRANVVVATWSAGIKDVHQVKWMCSTDLIADFKLLVDHSYKNRQQKYAASIEQLFGVENIRTSEMHAKFVLISNAGYKVSIRSSMNLNANRTCEIFEIDEGAQIFNFLQEFVRTHFNYAIPGFCDASSDVNKVLERYFRENEPSESIQKSKHWSDL